LFANGKFTKYIVKKIKNTPFDKNVVKNETLSRALRGDNNNRYIKYLVLLPPKPLSNNKK